MSAPTDFPSAAAPVRRFGRFELRTLLGRSERTMAWRAFDARAGRELLLVLPRQQPADAAALDAWLADARRLQRVAHPALAAPVEVGAAEHWPFAAYDTAAGLTLPEWIARHGAPAPPDAVRWLGEALHGLAFAHDAGFAHHDVQPQLLAIDDHGHARWLGLGAALAPQPITGVPTERSEHREQAERDLLAAGVLLHTLLAARPALDEPDIGRVVDRLAPRGREFLRLPRLTPKPLDAALRAITDRATNGQPRLRYRSARTLQRALEGWLQAHEQADGGPIARLLERLDSVGHLPALPGVTSRVARLALMEKGRTQEMAELVLEDMALAFELLRLVNTAQVQGTQMSGGAPVLTVRRAIAMLGLDGVRYAAQALRDWPGPLPSAAARELRALFERVRLAGRVAMAVRPAGYDAEVVFLVALLQNLGRLLVQYHFAEEAAEIRELMRGTPAERDGDGERAGMSESDAAAAVLGAELDAFGAAAARQWGLRDEVMHLIRRLNPAVPVRTADHDGDLIRGAASCANEAVDALALPAAKQPAAIEKIAQRYAKLLGIVQRDLEDALQGARASAAVSPTIDLDGLPVLSDAA